MRALIGTILPPNREIGFTIDLMPGTTPMFKTHYCIAAAKFIELWTQV